MNITQMQMKFSRQAFQLSSKALAIRFRPRFPEEQVHEDRLQHCISICFARHGRTAFRFAELTSQAHRMSVSSSTGYFQPEATTNPHRVRSSRMGVAGD